MLAIALLVMLTLSNASAAATATVPLPVRAGVQDPAGDASISMAPEGLDRLPGGSPGDATTAEIERMNARILSTRDAGALGRGSAKKIKIGVPNKQDFKAFVNATSQKVTGYSIDVFDAALKNIPLDLDYELIVFNGSYDQLVHNVSSGILDAAVGDITITAERAVHVDFTMPYTESGVSLLVLTENDSKSTIEWVFLKPLTTQLWLATVGGFLFTGLVVWMIERPKNLEYQGSSSRQFSTALYFSFSTLTFSHALTLLIRIAKSVHAKYTKVRDSDMQNADGGGGSEGHGGSGPLQNDMGNWSTTEQPNHEARNEDPPGVNGIGESPGDVEPNDSARTRHPNRDERPTRCQQLFCIARIRRNEK
ncbi:uncharacterized protein LOC123408291 [Hordeum vulgare subsp. vulgare]|uniref:uncharacterized protein LOC123408291 n=1 Tax=Hordeum vulgare subsp. vulgare TaxID=112509 RepID=UPI001D1A4438|nr:uncharacterized protein LOC123408291 [Hordeum vulgare subsp. vulgare]